MLLFLRLANICWYLEHFLLFYLCHIFQNQLFNCINGWIGKKFITNPIFLYGKLEVLPEWHYCLYSDGFYWTFLSILRKISFLDILTLRNGNNQKLNHFETNAHLKSTGNDIYVHRESFAPNAWKWGKFRTLFLRPHVIFSTKEQLD